MIYEYSLATLTSPDPQVNVRVRHFVVAPGKGRFCLRYFNHVESKYAKVDQTICTESKLHS